MPYQYTGKYRATQVKVDYTDSDGNSLSGFPVTYNILNAFSDPTTGNNYPAITDDAGTGETKEFKFATMPEAQYLARVDAFYNYVNAQHSNLDTEASVIAGKEPTGTSVTCQQLISTEMDPGSIAS